MGSFNDLEGRIVEHSRKVLKEAVELKERMISPIALSSVYKRRWELEVADIVSEFLGERVTLLGKDSGLTKGESEWICLCDLLDGSKNFLADTKYYSYNLALAREENIVYAIVVDLENMSVYKAEKGRGSTLNGKSLKEIAMKRAYRYEIISSNVSLPGVDTVTMRCSSLELCALAQGSAWVAIGDTWNIDIAASYLIAVEAGNSFYSWDLSPWRLPVKGYTRVRYVAGTGKAVAEFVKKYGDKLREVGFSQTN